MCVNMSFQDLESWGWGFGPLWMPRPGMFITLVFTVTKEKEMPDVKVPNKGELWVGLKVVDQMVKGLENLDHVVVTGNYFTSKYFFIELLIMDIYAIGTTKSNRIGLPKTLRAKKKLRKALHGTIEWRIYKSRSIYIQPTHTNWCRPPVNGDYRQWLQPTALTGWTWAKSGPCL